MVTAAGSRSFAMIIMQIMIELRAPLFLYQGEFRAGAAHSKINPADGMLYVVGLDGWGNYALDDGSLERIRYTGKALPMLEQVHGYENGIELQFSSKLTGNALSYCQKLFCPAMEL